MGKGSGWQMIDGIARRLGPALHNRVARAILAAPPIAPVEDGSLIFSMIGTRVLLPYLVAVKSLHARLGRGRVAILDDGTLTAADRRVLADHCGDPEIRSIRDVDTGPCPRGGCWERLLTLLDLTERDYVIQLDSDTVTLGAIPEVAEAIAANRAFTLLGGEDAEARGLLSLPAFMAACHPEGPVDPAGPVHVQLAIEGNWRRYPDAARHRYVRGCAGFAGFPRGGPGRAAAEAFSRNAEAIVGREVWRRWGSEQVASNFLVSNSPDPLLLPYDRYANYWNEAPGADMRFLHFVGTHRYAKGEYRRRTRQAIAALG
ncbi:MAG TPA: hypothetical protein VFL92_09090 [Sphingomonas sp.]|nr:hypothetical protein [Sphingomonas sp.]